ncbi:hypothetical protein V5739_12105 [Salinimicrobium sp. TIG7-5_MAKvit]|jgi:hypothetical protein|uniref:hypothetical protein n=1 Tax=Salinimicrobium sp. TIG7-5_MAKvit TaxID=3121289 RepID=UPI003C6E5BCD
MEYRQTEITKKWGYNVIFYVMLLIVTTGSTLLGLGKLFEKNLVWDTNWVGSRNDSYGDHIT